MQYSIILRNKDKIDNLKMKIDLSEDIDSIAYTANVDMIVPEEYSKNLLLMEGDAIEIIDNEKQDTVFKGIIWDKNTSDQWNKTASLVCKERTVYLEESEDEYLFREGQTATQRARIICNDWNIPVGKFADTGVGLSKSPPKIGTLYGMMLDDLKETAEKGGKLYRYRMENKLDLIEIGKNEPHKLTDIKIDITQKGSLQGAVTRVKVLGNEDLKDGQKQNKLSPIIGTYSKDPRKIGTFQKVLQDDKVKNAADAKAKAEKMFSSGERSITVNCLDIKEARAGDKVELNGFHTYITSIKHYLGNPGRMTVTLESINQIRSKYY